MALRPDARVLVATLSTGPVVLLAVDDEGGGERVYGREDWRDECGPSFNFDDVGDLRTHNGERVYGPAIEYRDGTEDDIRVAWGDVADSGVLVDGPGDPCPNECGETLLAGSPAGHGRIACDKCQTYWG